MVLSILTQVEDLTFVSQFVIKIKNGRSALFQQAVLRRALLLLRLTAPVSKVQGALTTFDWHFKARHSLTMQSKNWTILNAPLEPKVSGFLSPVGSIL